MIFRTDNKVQANKCRARIEYLIKKGAKIEVLHKQHKRTLPQNSYLHLILQYYGVNVGLNLVEAKKDFKDMNSDIFNYEKNGKWYVRSSADLDKEEMMICIDRFKKESLENGIPLPDSEDVAFVDEARNEIESAKQYL